MAETLGSQIKQFLRDPPGERFARLHQRWNTPASAGEVAWQKLLYIGIGLLLLCVGLLLSLPPGSPGFLLWFPGLVMIVSRLKFMAILLDRVELFFRRLVARPRQ